MVKETSVLDILCGAMSIANTTMPSALYGTIDGLLKLEYFTDRNRMSENNNDESIVEILEKDGSRTKFKIKVEKV